MTNEPPSPEPPYHPFGPPLPKTTGPDPESLRRKAQARAEMEALARRNQRLGLVTKAGVILLVIGGLALVLRWISGTILDSHYRAGVKAYESYAKDHVSCQGKNLFEDRAASLLGEAIASRPADYTNAYIYLASMKLLQYRCEVSHEGASADTGLLSQAGDDCNHALGIDAKDAAACYFLGAVNLFQNDQSGCLSYLDRCLKAADTGSKRGKEWTEQAQQMKALVSGSTGQATAQFRLLPIPDMLPAWTMVH